MATSTPPKLQGLHHIKLAASDLKVTEAFYNDVLGFATIPEFTHRKPDGTIYAEIMRGPGDVWVEVRQSPEQAKAQVGWDPVTWSVQGEEDLQAWQKWLESKNVKHSRVFTGAKGWLLACEDPDGKHVRLYTLDSHPWTENTDTDEYWLG